MKKMEASCLDCKMPYKDMGLDCVLPRGQWLMICPEDRILCGNCILKRASKIKGATTTHLIIDILQHK